MQKLMLIFGIFLLYFLPFGADGKEKDPCHYSTEGTDFWFGFMENRINGPEHYIAITVSSRKGAELTLTYGPGETPIGKYTVAANSSEPISIDYNLLEASGSETIENKGIHLVATDSVNVYALNYRTRSSDVAVIYPTESLGKEYFAMCYTPHPTNTIESNTEFLIVATVDNTNVKITPSIDTDKGKKANSTLSVTLNKGQSYQVQSMNSNIAWQGDLTGSYVVSDQPIAFYSGVKSTAVPYTGQTRDHLYEQIPPTNTWGREFYIVPLRRRDKDTYRVLAAEDGTIVTIGGQNKTVTLKRGIFYEFELNSSEACLLTASKKVLLAQFCRSQEVDGNNGVGDPFMIILSPISQKINDVTFEAYESKLIQNIFFINIITLTSEAGNLLLDQTKIADSFKAFPNSKYSYAQVPTTKGTHRLQNPDKDGGFLAYVYGFGDNNNTESYGYGVGFNLNIQLDIGGSFEITNDTLQICHGTEVKLEAGEYFVNYDWKTGEKTPFIMASKPQWYSVTATTAAGCIKTDSIYIRVNQPEIHLGKDALVCLPGDLVIEAEKGFKAYRWQDGSTNPTYTVDSTGYYSVTVTNNFGCEATDTLYVKVILPTLAFNPDFPVVTISHPDITFINHTEGALTYQWDFGDGTTSVEISPTHHYSNLGKYPVILKAVSVNNCTYTYSTEVEVIPFTFVIPNAFRPDSDLPENRIFMPILNAVDPNKYHFQVFNRVGSVVFETGIPTVGWDGFNSEQGVYVWIVKYSDFQGYEHAQKGNVMLVR